MPNEYQQNSNKKGQVPESQDKTRINTIASGDNKATEVVPMGSTAISDYLNNNELHPKQNRNFNMGGEFGQN